MFAGPSYNTLDDYKKCGWLPLTENIDELDECLLRESHRMFVQIKEDDALCILWGRTLGRLDLSHEFFQREIPWDKSKASDFPYKRQSVRVLIKRFNTLLSRDSEPPQPNPPELDAVIRICKLTRLFFNGPTHKLDHLLLRMFSVDREALHPFQWAAHPDFPSRWMPTPPKSCWRDPQRWSHEDWPEDHMTSWDFAYSLLQGLVRLDKYWTVIHPREGIVASAEGTLGEFWELMFGEGPVFGMREGLSSKGSDFCIKYSLSELERSERFGVSNWPSEIKDRVSNISSPRVCLNLLRTGIPPSMIFDISEALTQKPTLWKQGDRSVMYISSFLLYCEYGSKEEVKTFLEDPNCIRNCYASLKDFSDTPYKRAVRNSQLGALILLLQEAARDPEGLLAREIQECDLEPEEPRKIWSYSGFWPRYEKWRRYPKNHLILACVERNVELAKYLVEEKEKEAREASSSEEDEIYQIVKAADIVSEFVNRPGSSGAPLEAPMDIAIREGQVELAAFLSSKGAQLSADLEIQVQDGEMTDILRRSREEQNKLRQQIKTQGYNITVTSRLVGQLSRIEAQSQELLKRMIEQQSQSDSLGEKIKKNLEKAREQRESLRAINKHLKLFEDAQKQALVEEATRQERNCREAFASGSSAVDVF